VLSVKPFTFVHTADCHLDTPFAGIAREDPKLAVRLREAQRAVFDDLIALCVDRDAAFLVIAGDLYDARERSLTTRVRLREAFRRLAEANIRVYLATGNHDNLADSQVGFSFPENVHLFSADRPETFVVEDDEPIASLTGISHGQDKIAENLAARFPPAPEDLFSVAVLHCNVGGDPAHDDYAPCRLADLQRQAYGYWALGHVHQRRVLAEGRPTIVYPGCLQGRRIGERGEKGAMVARVDERGNVELEFAPLNRIERVEADVDVGDIDSEESLVERLRQQADELVAAASPRVEGLIVRWALHGRMEWDIAAQQHVIEALRESASAEPPFVWTEGIDAGGTVAPVDIDALADEESPRGDLIQLVRRIESEPVGLEQIRDRLLERVGPAEHARDLQTDRPLEAIVGEALRLGVDWLSRRDER
jgi:DNA repair exonuclease SbcCD nuclease subunit